MPKILEPRGRMATALQACEKKEFLAALREADGRVTVAAILLGISERAAWRLAGEHRPDVRAIQDAAQVPETTTVS